MYVLAGTWGVVLVWGPVFSPRLPQCCFCMVGFLDLLSVFNSKYESPCRPIKHLLVFIFLAFVLEENLVC